MNLRRPALDEVQRLFAAAILDNDDGACEQLAGKILTGTPAFPTVTRLTVYHDAYWIRLLNALADNFRKTLRAVGGKAFEPMALDYLRGHSSRSFTLRDLGTDFPDWLQERPECILRPYLPDLTRLEWAALEAFDAPDTPRLDTGSLATFALEQWPGLVFEPVASLRQVRMRWDLMEMWDRLEQNQPASAAIPNPGSTLVWRDGLMVRRRHVRDSEEAASVALLSGRTFAEVCEASPDGAAAAVLLKRALTEGWLASVSVRVSSDP